MQRRLNFTYLLADSADDKLVIFFFLQLKVKEALSYFPVYFYVLTSLLCYALYCTITKTYLYNSDPLKPHFYIVKLGFIGVYIIFSYFC